jgi:hypothetical protein
MQKDRRMHRLHQVVKPTLVRPITRTATAGDCRVRPSIAGIVRAARLLPPLVSALYRDAVAFKEIQVSSLTQYKVTADRVHCHRNRGVNQLIGGRMRFIELEQKASSLLNLERS